jgi:hypothetical protein
MLLVKLWHVIRHVVRLYGHYPMQIEYAHRIRSMCASQKQWEVHKHQYSVYIVTRHSICCQSNYDMLSGMLLASMVIPQCKLSTHIRLDRFALHRSTGKCTNISIVCD